MSDLAHPPAPVAPLLLVALLAFLAAAAITVALTRPLIGWLRDRQFGKAIRVDGPDHSAKAGTPTMGGLAALAAIAVTAASVAAFAPIVVNHGALVIPIAAMLLFGALGLVDDVRGILRRSGHREAGVGLSARGMFASQVAVALVVFVWLRAAGFDMGVAAPVGTGGLVALIAVAVLAIVGTANGLNLSDGLDGLAAGLSVIAFSAIAVAAARLAQTGAVAAGTAASSALAAACAGASLGFLVFNRHPARVFMGNVTSMALGAGLATLCLVTGLWLLLPVIAAVLVLEVASDILQVAYFKASHGRRLLRMAPLHHHFELGGMPETEVVRRFWLGGAAAALTGLAILFAFTSG